MAHLFVEIVNRLKVYRYSIQAWELEAGHQLIYQ